MIRMMMDDRFDTMPWDEIDAVVFDVGNVLLSFQPQELLARILPDCPELRSELARRIFQSPYWCMRDRGSATAEEVIGAMSRTAPALEPYIRRVMTQWIDLPPMPEGIEALRTCRAHGKKLYALTNYADREFAHACETHGFFSFFDGCVVSGRLGLVKPEHEIYEHLTGLYGLDPARTLFIDDSIANVEGALNCGWQGMCYTYAGQLARFFQFEAPYGQ